MSNLAKFLMLLGIGLVLAAVSLWQIGGKKRKYEASATVSATPSQVFPCLIELDKRKKWIEGLVDQELMNADAIGEGARLRTVVESNGQTDDFDGEVLRFIDDEIVTIQSRSDRMMSTRSVRLEDDSSGSKKTKITYQRIIVFNGLERFKSLFSTDDYQREVENDLNRLVKLAESQPVEQESPAAVGQTSAVPENATPSEAGQDTNQAPSVTTSADDKNSGMDETSAEDETSGDDQKLDLSSQTNAG